MRLPQPVPELPVSDVQAAGKSYARLMGFSVDWAYQDSLAGISRDDARVFLRRRTPEEAKEHYSVLVWLNMGSSAEVDQLLRRVEGTRRANRRGAPDRSLQPSGVYCAGPRRQ